MRTTRTQHSRATTTRTQSPCATTTTREHSSLLFTHLLTTATHRAAARPCGPRPAARRWPRAHSVPRDDDGHIAPATTTWAPSPCATTTTQAHGPRRRRRSTEPPHADDHEAPHADDEVPHADDEAPRGRRRSPTQTTTRPRAQTMRPRAETTMRLRPATTTTTTRLRTNMTTRRKRQGHTALARRRRGRTRKHSMSAGRMHTFLYLQYILTHVWHYGKSSHYLVVALEASS